VSGPRRQGRHLAPSWLQRRHTGVVDPDPALSLQGLSDRLRSLLVSPGTHSGRGWLWPGPRVGQGLRSGQSAWKSSR
jgi:hypothetical protein